MVNKYLEKYKNINLYQWLWDHQRNIHFKFKYFGYHMQKNPMDLIVYMEIIQEQKPDYIIEIGAANGGTALWFCHQLDSLCHGKLISVDITHDLCKIKHERLIKITGDSTLKSTVDKVKNKIEKGSKCLIVQDGSHRKCDIKKDFENYSDLVNVGSYFIIEDGIMDVFGWKDHRTNGHDCGMYAGIEIEKENEKWKIDFDKEKYVATYNQCGFLKRIK